MIFVFARSPAGDWPTSVTNACPLARPRLWSACHWFSLPGSLQSGFACLACSWDHQVHEKLGWSRSLCGMGKVQQTMHPTKNNIWNILFHKLVMIRWSLFSLILQCVWRSHGTVWLIIRYPAHAVLCSSSLVYLWSNIYFKIVSF